jgi:hypothetical protein
MNQTTSGAALSGALGLLALTLCAGSGFAGSTNTNSETSSSTSIAGANSSSGSVAASTNAGNNQNISFNSPTIPTNTTLNNVPNVYAPGLAAAGSEVCLGSVSAGGAGAGFGVTIGGTFVDRECQLRLNARTLAVLGYPRAARETMCLDPDVRQAMAAAGTPCAADAYAPARYSEAPPPSQTAATNPFAALFGLGRQASAPQASAPQASPPQSLNANPFGAPVAQEAAAQEAAPPSQTAMANPAPGQTARANPGQTAMANPGKSKAHAKSVAVAAAQPEPVQNEPMQAAAADSPATTSDDVHPGCRKEYQFLGGWYEKCPE